MTREELKEYRSLKAESEQITRKMKELDNLMYSMKVSDHDGMPKGSASSNYRLENLMDKKDKLKRLYDQVQSQLLDGQYEIESLIVSLPSRERRLMRYYYIDGMTWEDVCTAMHYSWSQIHRIHAAALGHLKI